MGDDRQHLTIPRMVLDSSDRFAEREAVMEGGHRFSFADVQKEMLAVARALIAGGIEPGDRIGLWAPNSAAWIFSALGILATGAWLVPLNTRFRGSEASYILGKVDARAVLTVEHFAGGDYLRMLRDESPELPALANAVTLPMPGGQGSSEWEAFLARGDDVPEAEVLRRIDRIGPEDTSDVIFTSGTTGTPKGVVLRHGASLIAYESYNRGYGIGEGDRALIALPFSHTFGYKAGWMLDLRYGATTIPVPVFDPEEVMRLIETERVTHMPGAPTMFLALLDHPARASFDLSSLVAVTVAASTVPVELIYRLLREEGIKTCLAGYGMTESHGIISTTLPGDRAELVATTVGTPIPGVETRVVDDGGKDVATGEPGELLVRGYNVMSGYYGEPQATEDAFVDGWLKTGDVVVEDDDGYLRITDRKKDLFIMGGFNVAPAEVEKALAGFEMIAQVAVIGIPDERFGEVGMAFVIPKPGVDLTVDEVVAYAREHLANFKVPRRVEIVESFPLNATGKVLKNELRSLAVRTDG
ncbi:MAG TPA: AMP-binding protein [Acidimicrobiales bacterium]|nr:AMP-binding protein [Acidimicrobiales bacterium]